jgi:hypothetical protein
MFAHAGVMPQPAHMHACNNMHAGFAVHDRLFDSSRAHPALLMLSKPHDYYQQ